MYWKLGKVLCMIAIFLLPFIRVNAQNLSKTVHGTISLSVRNMPLRFGSNRATVGYFFFL